MKIIRLSLFVLILLISFSRLSFSQKSKIYEGALSQLYFDRQPNPKSEAMGRGLVANYDAEFGSYYNPALTSLGSGVNFNISHTALEEKTTDYNYIGIGYAGKKLGAFSISRYSWAEGIDPSGSSYKAHNSIHTLNYSREVSENFYTGINLELVHLGSLSHYYYSPYFDTEYGYYDQKASDALTVDIGVLKKFDLGDATDKNIERAIQIAGAIYNITGERIANKNDNTYEILPVIFRAGFSYHVKKSDTEKDFFSSAVESFTHFEVENILNATTYTSVKLGEELIIANFLILRTGLFNDGYNNSFRNKELQLSLGAGIKLDLGKIVNSDKNINLIFDYARSPSTPSSRYNDFNMYSMKVNYIP